ncbi:hypothetical protein [Calothrix sp. UHCC 0171]|uniref:hypothetical protein n=1 Tax=Calothrix sp. UHCC 0171 TaxID=3110245 RepID=UPI002B207085|nr:hypothetical protein [Calothrix sp. UHCC 0171]MEA5574389.1 hypothetical protein [Calothrix sp. UHCC 0171]
MKNQLLDAINQVISLKSGVAEYSNDNTLEALLPIDIAQSLDIPDAISFSTSAEGNDSYFVTYNSEIFDRFSHLLDSQGYAAALSVKYDGYLKTTGFEKRINDTFSPLNGLIRVGKAFEALTPYVFFNVSYTANADEKRLGMVSFFVNGLTGIPGVEIGDALSWKSDQVSLEDVSSLDNINFEPLLNTAQSHASKVIDREIAPWRRSLARKLGRDEERIRNYYNEIIGEINTKITRKNLEEEAKSKELARIQATQMELERKLLDLHDRYDLSVTAQLHSSLVILLQTVHIECELIRKKARRGIMAIWNPYLKIIEPWQCEKSNVPVTQFYLSDGDVQIISPEVWDNGVK